MRKFSFLCMCIVALLTHSLFAKSEMTNNLSNSDLPSSNLISTNTFIFAAKDGRDFNVALQQESKTSQNQSNPNKSKQDKSKKQSWIRFKPVFIYKDEATKQELIKKAPTLYVVVYHTASEFVSSDLEGEEGKVKLAHALVKNINAILVDSSGITAVTFLNFMLYTK